MNSSELALELLDLDRIKLNINAKTLQKLTKIDLFNSIASTNSYLLEQAEAGETGWVCLAEQQSRGRGRQGRTWFSPPGGNIYCSLLWRLPRNQQKGLSLAVAVMILDALRDMGVTADIGLKWPNDILFSGRKLAGILIESRGDAVVIGIGMNLLLPLEASQDWVSLSEIMQPQVIVRNQCVGLLLNHLLEQLPVFAREGFKPFIERWRAHDVLLGKTVTMNTRGQVFTGLAQGINESGELLLQDSEGQTMTCY